MYGQPTSETVTKSVFLPKLQTNKGPHPKFFLPLHFPLSFKKCDIVCPQLKDGAWGAGSEETTGWNARTVGDISSTQRSPQTASEAVEEETFFSHFRNGAGFLSCPLKDE